MTLLIKKIVYQYKKATIFIKTHRFCQKISFQDFIINIKIFIFA